MSIVEVKLSKGLVLSAAACGAPEHTVYAAWRWENLLRW